MPKLDDVQLCNHEFLNVPTLPWLDDAVGRGFVRGGVYLVSGEPGVGKSTLMQQALGDLARQSVKVLYMTSEQSLAELNSNVQRLFGGRSGRIPAAISENFHMDDRVQEVDELREFLSLHVLPTGAEYHGTKVLVFDSIQGRGLSASSTQKFKGLFEFMKVAKANGIVTFLLGHINKSGKIAGPKTLEHNVDCVLYMRKAFTLRPLFVPKNRFGPAVLDPIPLVMDKCGRLGKSPQATVKTTSIPGYTGQSMQLADVQASVSLAKYGSKPEFNHPSLPRQKMKQLIKVLSELKDVDLSELSYELNAYIPGNRGYGEELDLPLAVALLSSYLHQPVPRATLFIGELDLLRRIRPPKATIGYRLAGIINRRSDGIKRVYMSDRGTAEFAERVRGVAEVRGVPDLETLLREMWPALLK